MGREIDLSKASNVIAALVEVDWRAATWCTSKVIRRILALDDELLERWRSGLDVCEGFLCGTHTKASLEAKALEFELHAETAQNREARTGPGLETPLVSSIVETCHSVLIEPVRATVAISLAETSFVRLTQFLESDLQVPVMSLRRSFQENGAQKILAEPWLATHVSTEKLSTAPPGVQVAWDLLGPELDQFPILELFDHFYRAQRLGLDWNDAVQRAVAERAKDEENIRKILFGA